MWSTDAGDTWKLCGHFLLPAPELSKFPEILEATTFTVTSFWWMLQDSESEKFPWFLTFICRGRFLPRYFNHESAKVCIFQPSLRTRRCVGFLNFFLLSRQVSLLMLWVSPCFSTQSDGSRMRKWSRQLVWGTLPWDLILPQSLLRQLLPFCFWLSSPALPVCSRVFPIFSHCCLCIWCFHCLRQRNKFVHSSAVNESVPFPAKWSSWFLWGDPSMRFLTESSASSMQAYCVLHSSTRQVSLYFSQLKCAKHCGWHRYSQLSSRILHGVFEFLIIRINEVNTTQSSGVVELWFLDSPFLFFFAFRRIGHIFPNLRPHSVWSGGRLFSCQSPPGPCTSIRVFRSKKVNLVKPLHVSDNSRSPSTFQ